MSILIVLASGLASTGGGCVSCRNGFAQVYYFFKDEGVKITLASLEGGWPWPGLTTRNPKAAGNFVRLAQDEAAREQIADTLSLDQIFIDDFEAAYCIGLLGPIWRTANQASAEAVLARFLAAGKPVAIMPSNLDLAPHGAGSGLLITGEAEPSAIIAAQILLAATRARTATS